MFSHTGRNLLDERYWSPATNAMIKKIGMDAMICRISHQRLDNKAILMSTRAR